MEFRLYFGSKFTGIRVVSDEKYPRMWRISGVGGELEGDIVNLTRAKDAAITWGREAYPEAEGRSSVHFKWKVAHSSGEAPRTARLGISRRVR